MKSKIQFPIVAVAGGMVCFALRLWQNLVGFERDTGLAVAGTVPAWLLPLVLAALALWYAYLTRRMPQEAAGAFSSTDAPCLFAAVTAACGLLLALVSGGLRLAAGLQGGSRLDLLLGVFALASAGALLPAVRLCRRGGSAPSAAFLAPVAYCVILLVLTYRESSVDPVLADYYVEILAQAFLILGFYTLSSFGYQCGQTRRFAFCAMLAVTLSLTVLADKLPLEGLPADWVGAAFYGGGALFLLGFLRVRLLNRGPSAPPKLPRTILRSMPEPEDEE